jgi:hypothetical protein
MSGRRPASNCGEVEVVSKTGETKVRSMVMTEYFVKGSEPYDDCPLHQGVGLLTRLGGLFGGGPSPAPVPEAASPLPEHSVEPPAATATQAPTPAAERREEEPKKKRGFWGRLFGSRKASDKDKEKDRDRDPDR